MPVLARLTLAAVGTVLLLLLWIATRLSPNEQGMGTHQQLGLPPCSYWIMFGHRCPSCGMTTAWSHLTRGNIARACEANLGGTLLGALAMLASPWTLLAAVRGRWPGPVPTERWCVLVVLGLVIVTLIDWTSRMFG